MASTDTQGPVSATVDAAGSIDSNAAAVTPNARGRGRGRGRGRERGQVAAQGGPAPAAPAAASARRGARGRGRGTSARGARGKAKKAAPARGGKRKRAGSDDDDDDGSDAELSEEDAASMSDDDSGSEMSFHSGSGGSRSGSPPPAEPTPGTRRSTRGQRPPPDEEAVAEAEAAAAEDAALLAEQQRLTDVVKAVFERHLLVKLTPQRQHLNKIKTPAPPVPPSQDPDAKEDQPLVIQTMMSEDDDRRYKCYVPGCGKDFLNVVGIKYHGKNHTHHLEDFLALFCPKAAGPDDMSNAGQNEPGTADGIADADDAGAAARTSRSLIDTEILSLYDKVFGASSPELCITFDDYPVLIPGQVKPTKCPATFGISKELQPKKPRVGVGRPRSNGLGGADMAPLPVPDMIQLSTSNNANHPRHVSPLPSGVDLANVAICDERDIQDHLPLPNDQCFVVRDAQTASEPTVVSRFQAVPVPPCPSAGEQGQTQRKRFHCNVGGSVWGLDWCPIPSSKDVPAPLQYLAVAGYKGTIEEHHVVGVRQEPSIGSDMQGSIQIWSFQQPQDRSANDSAPHMELCIIHDYGCVFDLKWGPQTFYQNADEALEGGRVPRLGLLAVTFGDGNMRVLEIPHPATLRNALNIPESREPLFARVRAPLFEALIPDTTQWKIAWGGERQIATGCTNGSIAIWDPLEIPSSQPADSDSTAQDAPPADDPHKLAVDPIAYFPAQDACIFGIAYTSGPHYSSIISCGGDGRLLTRDIRVPWLTGVLYRARGFLNTCAYIPAAHVVAVADPDNIVRCMNPGDEDMTHAREEEDALAFKQQRSAGLMWHSAPIWSVEASPHIPFMASAGADGSVQISNFRRTRKKKSQRPMQVMLYNLTYDTSAGILAFQESMEPELMSTAMANGSSGIMQFYPPEVAIQRLAWNPNDVAPGWMASGGTAGFVRIETCFGL
ncbi:General transcription factor 3C polypeptide 2 [Geranomyces variabilis]|nr:General transcription factor 3C polypeptide 2 [Geranomyces variabilis]